jgi:hypothetical protein
MPCMTSAKTRTKMCVLWTSLSLSDPDLLTLCDYFPHPPSCPFYSSKIRIQGYKAVVQMSREQPGSVERNVDVLVQLLQSGRSLNGGECRVLIRRHVRLPVSSLYLYTR